MKDQNFLVLVRHGQSEWNAKNLFTGWKDPGLTAVGETEAAASVSPTAVSPGSFHPVNKFLAFHSLCPCRTRTKKF